MKTDDYEGSYSGGIYAFINQILAFTWESIESPLPELESLDLKELKQNPDATSGSYYKHLKHLILEESRAVIQQNLNRYTKLTPVILSDDTNFITRPDEPIYIKFKGKLPLKQQTGGSGSFLVLRFKNKNYSFLVMADGYGKGEIKEYKGRFICDNIRDDSELLELFEQGIKWQVQLIASLVTQSRMYATCFTKPDVDFIDNLVAGKIKSAPESHNIEITEQEIPQPWLSQLNDSQLAAITSFQQATNPISLLQGPPGTGKTTTIVALARELVAKKQHVMICAPSNKAVQVLASRFHQLYPDIAIALSGVKNGVPWELRDVFIDGMADEIGYWNAKIIKIIDAICSDKNKLTFNQIEKFLSIIQEQWQNVLAIEKLHNLTSLLDVMFPECNIKLSKSDQKIFNQYSSLPYKVIPQELSFLNATDLPDAVDKLRNELKTLKKHIMKINMVTKNYTSDNYNSGLKAHLLNNAKIIFCTLSVAGRKSLIDNVSRCDTLIVDEAGQAVEAETLIALNHSPSKLLLVGDVQQLPATVISKHAKQYGFEQSLLWRLQVEYKQPATLLSIQYRMDPAIRQWPSSQYYDGQLQDGDVITTRSKPKYLCEGALLPYQIIDVSGNESRVGTSRKNNIEISAIIDQLYYLVNNKLIDKTNSIGIITFYEAQAGEFKQKLYNKFKGFNISVNTVDGFQGDECDIIFISSVCANDTGNIGFTTDYRRLNVAITRAKFALAIYCNFNTFLHSKSDLASLIKDAMTRGCTKTYQTSSASKYSGIQSTQVAMSALAIDKPSKKSPPKPKSPRTQRLIDSMSESAMPLDEFTEAVTVGKHAVNTKIGYLQKPLLHVFINHRFFNNDKQLSESDIAKINILLDSGASLDDTDKKGKTAKSYLQGFPDEQIEQIKGMTN